MILIPEGGLCNRLRVIACAYSLCKNTGQKLTVIWEINKALGCNSNDIFSNSGDFKIVNIREDRLVQLLQSIYFVILRRSGRKNITFFEDGKEFDRIKRESKQDGSEYILKSETVIKTCDVFYQMDYSFITWNSKLQNEADKIVGDVADYVGIHIRRTDHKEAITYSTDEKFDRIIRGLIEKNRKIYLATDDVELGIKFIDKYGYGNFIYNIDKDRRRDDKHGMENACIDVINLSRSVMIYGSFQSSFSELAARISNIPLIVV